MAFTADMISGYKSGTTPVKQPSYKPTTPKLSSSQSDKIWSGGTLSDIGDFLSIPQYAASGLWSGIGIGKGISTREIPSKIMRRSGSIDDSWGGKAKGFAADLILDPLNLAAGVGLAGKVLGKVGKVGKIAGAVSAGEKLAQGARFLEPFNLVGKTGKGIARTVLGADRFENIAKGLKSAPKLKSVRPVLGETEKAVSKIELKLANKQNASIVDDLINSVKSGDQALVNTLIEKLPNLESKTRATAITDAYFKAANELGMKIAPKVGPAIPGVPLLEARTSGISSMVTADGSIVRKVSDTMRKGKIVSPPRVGKGFVTPAKELVTEMKKLKTQAVKDLRLLYTEVTQPMSSVVKSSAEQLLQEGDAPVAKTFRDKAVEKLNDVSQMIGRWVEATTEKLDPSYLTRKNVMKGSISAGVRQAEKLAKNVSVYAQDYTKVAVGPKINTLGKSAAEIEKAASRRIWEIATGSKSVAKSEEPLRQAAALIRTNVDALSTDLVEEMAQIFPDKATEIKNILENMGTYLPEYFLKYLNDKPAFVSFITGGEKANLDRLIARKDIPEALRRQLGAIRDGALVGGRAVADMTDMLEKGRFFRWVAQNFIVSSADEAAMLSGKFTKLPKNAKLGVLSEKIVPNAIAKDIMGMQDVTNKTGLDAYIQKIYKKLISLWKIGKVILNPAAQGKDFMSNMVLMDMAGYPTFLPKGVKLLGESIQQVIKGKGKYYDEALKMGLMETTQRSVELGRMVKELSSGKVNPIKAFMTGFVDKSGDTYQGIESIGKLAVYSWRRGEGDDMAKAAAWATETLFDYSDIPEWVRVLRDIPFGFPFITFGYKATGATIKTIGKRPTAISKYYKLARNIEDQERKNEEFALPEYIKNGMYVKLPWNSEIKMKDGSIKSQPLYLDLNYILPWAAPVDIVSSLGTPSNPMISITAAVVANRDPFMGTEIWNEASDTSADRTRKLINYIYRTIAPSFAPGTQPIEDIFGLKEVGITGGYSWDKLYNAIARKPDYKGRIRDIPITLSDVWLGIKAVPVDIEAGAASASKSFKYNQGQIRAEIRKVARDQSLSEAQKAERIRQLTTMIQEQAIDFGEEASTFRPNIIKPK